MQNISSGAQARQTRQRLTTQDDILSYELGKSVKELPPLYTRILGIGFSVLIFGTLGWAHFSKIDEVAVAMGKLVPEEQLRPVRSLGAGSIQVVNVENGDRVKKGQILVQRNPAISQAEIDRLQKSAQLIREDIARLQAERTGAKSAGVTLQDQLLAARLQDFEARRAAAIAQANQQLAAIAQAKIRRSSLQENLATAKASLVNAKTNLVNAKSVVTKVQASLEVAQKREQSLQSLLDSGAIPRLQYLEVQERMFRTEAELTKAKDEVTSVSDKINEAGDRVTSLGKDIAAQEEEIRKASQAYQAAQNEASRTLSQRQSEIIARLNQRREELATIEGQIVEAKKQQELEIIKAPVSGTVYNLKATTGPVQAGEELLSILPEGEEILLEVKVLNRDIGFIAQGMKAKVKIATFPFQEFGTVDGEVIEISPDAVMDEDLGLVFPTKVKLHQQVVKIPGKGATDLAPGMMATGEIVTRQKSILAFLIEPVMRQFSEAFSVR